MNNDPVKAIENESISLKQWAGVVFAYLAMELDFLEGLDKITSLVDTLFFEQSTENGTKSE